MNKIERASWVEIRALRVMRQGRQRELPANKADRETYQ